MGDLSQRNEDSSTCEHHLESLEDTVVSSDGADQ